jgi:hypothetical protein
MTLTQGYLYVGDASNHPTATSSIFVASNGNVGVGTTSPYSKLSVAGTVVASNYIATTSTSTLVGLTLSNLDCSAYGNNGKITTDGNGNLICAADNGGDGTGAAGDTTQVQFNNGGNFAGSSYFTWNDTTHTLSINGTTTSSVFVSTSTDTNTFAGSIQTDGTLSVDGVGTSTFANGVNILSASTTILRNNVFYQNGLGDCSGENQTLLYNSTTGTFSCGLDAGAGASSNVWATTTNDLAIYPTDTNFQVIIGAIATTTNNKLEVHGTTSASVFVATSTATSTFAGGVQIDGNLDVNGTATSTFNNGIVLTNGCFRDASGNCIKSGDATALDDLTDVDTTGKTAGDILYWTGSEWQETSTSTLVADADLGNLTESTSNLLTITGGTNAVVGDVTIEVDDDLSHYDNSTSAFITLASISATSPVQYNNTTGVISMSQANATTDGYLSQTDWTTFNNKWDSLNDMTLTQGYLYVGDASNHPTATSSIFVASNGNVGVGTTSPRASFEVSGTTVLSTTTMSVWNNVIVVDGIHYSADGNGIKQAKDDLPDEGGKWFIPA